MSVQRNLDGIYFRVKRGEKWLSVCFSDLTQQERDDACKDRSADWYKSLAYHLADCIQSIGDELGIMGE